MADAPVVARAAAPLLSTRLLYVAEVLSSQVASLPYLGPEVLVRAVDTSAYYSYNGTSYVALGTGGGGGGTYATLSDLPTDDPDLVSALNLRLLASDVVNDLTTGGTAKALSAEQGKTLQNTKLAILQAEATIASAATTDLGTTASEQVTITGTTTITSFGTAAAGTRRAGRFSGQLTLTHNATSLILPGGANITTSANDRFMAVSLGGGNWLVLMYVRANGQPVISTVNTGLAQDVTGVTRNGDGSVATYTMNGVTWTIAYRTDGQPNTETAGTLVKTYNYDGAGNFTGITGAVNAGESDQRTLSTLKSAANSAPGDRAFVTDVGRIIAKGVDLGQLGHLFEFVGPTGTGMWMPVGAFDVDSRNGDATTPVGSIAGVISTSTLIPSATLVIPGGLLKAGMRLEVRVKFRKTGGATAANTIVKFGPNNSAGDTSGRLVGLSATNNIISCQDYELLVTSSTTMQVWSTLGNQTGELDSNLVSLTGLNLANPFYISGCTNLLSSGETLQVLSMNARLMR